jgi:hypothetical protein
MVRKATFKPEELFAFWNYDQYPYVLGGTITEIDDSGLVQTKEYGQGTRFKPVKILPVTSGRALSVKLKHLGEEYKTAQKQLHEMMMKELAALMPEAVDRVRKP